MTDVGPVGPELHWDEARLDRAVRVLASAAGLAVRTEGREPPAVSDPAVRVVMAATAAGLHVEEARARHVDAADRCATPPALWFRSRAIPHGRCSPLSRLARAEPDWSESTAPSSPCRPRLSWPR